jgi:hypothetical protein
MLFKRQMQPQLQLGAGERRLQQAAAGARAGPGPSDVQRHLSYQCALFQQRRHRQRARRRSCRRRRRKRGKNGQQLRQATAAPRGLAATPICGKMAGVAMPKFLTGTTQTGGVRGRGHAVDSGHPSSSRQRAGKLRRDDTGTRRLESRINE